MNQVAAAQEQIYNVELPENYYSKPDYSYWYNYRLIDKSFSGNPTATERFIDSIYDQLPINAPNHLKRRKKKALNNIICNLLSAYRYNQMLCISRDRTKYSIPKIYGMDHYTYAFIIKYGVDAFEKTGYVYQEKGYFDIPRNEREITRICATDRLINEYYTFSNVSDENYKLVQNRVTGSNIICIEPIFKKLRYATPIQLKNEDKKLISYLPVRKIRQMRDNLNEYNSLLSKVEVISPHTTTLPPPHHTLPIIRYFG